MYKESFEDRLLSLHYVLPVPLNRLQPLLKESPDLTNINKLSIHQLSILLNLSYERTSRFINMFKRVVTTPFRQAYKNHDIIPIPYTHKDYPTMLFQLNDPPAVLYAKGNTELLQKLKIALKSSCNSSS